MAVNGRNGCSVVWALAPKDREQKCRCVPSFFFFVDGRKAIIKKALISIHRPFGAPKPSLWYAWRRLSLDCNLYTDQWFRPHGEFTAVSWLRVIMRPRDCSPLFCLSLIPLHHLRVILVYRVSSDPRYYMVERNQRTFKMVRTEKSASIKFGNSVARL